MGFFSSLIKVVGGVARSFLGVPAAVAPRALPALRTRGPRALAAARRIVPQVAAGAAGGLAVEGVAGLLTSLPHPGPVGAPTIDPVSGAHVHMGGAGGRGNGMVARQTIVQTIDLRTGAVLRQEVFTGAPFLMNSDVRKLRSISKKVLRASSKIPRRAVSISKTKQLTDAVVSEALRNVALPCPTKT